MKNKKPAPLFRDKFFGAPYSLGGQSKEDGFDCVSLVGSYHKELGNKVPDFSDLYPMYDSDPKKALKLMWKRLFNATEKIPLGEVVFGDVVVFKSEDGILYPGIFLGNGNVGSCFVDKGVVLIKYNILDLVDARRFR